MPFSRGALLFKGFAASLLLSIITAVPGAIAANVTSSHCPAFPESPHYRTPANTLTADPSNWVQTIRAAEPGDEILLEDGVYTFDGYAVVFEKPLTIRSKSGRPQDVVIQGHGYGEPSEALMIMADDVHIADITVKDVHDHAISFKENFARSIVYNVDLFDIGTQHIKGSHMGPDGVIACSNIGYQNPTGTGDYNSGIDLHGAVSWTIRDNTFYNIYGDGSGCVVDRDCGTQYPGGGSAILIWNNSRDNTIERNKITESFRGISLGLSTPYSGGIVRNNVIYRALAGKEGVNGFIEADSGISMIGAENVVVEGNSVILAGDYPGPIEVQDASGIKVVNNVISKPVWNRGNADYNGCTSQNSADCDDEAFGNTLLQTVAVQTADADSDAANTPENITEESPAIEDVQAIIVDTKPAVTPLPQQTADSTSTDDKAKELLTRINTTMAQLQQERILATTERLKMMEERLRFKEAKLELREKDVAQRETNVQRTLLAIQGSINSTKSADEP